MSNTSTIHIKTDFDCIVYDYGQQLGTTKADTYFNIELRKGEHELTFALAEDDSVFKTINYLVECADFDYKLVITIADELCDKAKGYFYAKQRSLAQKLFGLAAKKGHAEAQYYFGCCCLSEIATSFAEWENAASWWSKAAEQGNINAQYELGQYYRSINWNPIKALEWISKAAEQGDKEAQHELIGCYYELGSCYEEGNGVEKDIDKAVEWYTKAAEQGDVNAQYWLGNWYRNFNYVKAIEWYTKAAEHGADINLELWSCYDDLGHFCEISAVDREHIAKIELLTKIAEQGYANAQCSLGYCYEYGKSVERNLTKAVEWYTKAAEQGHARAQYNLGLCYGRGTGVETNLTKAIEWCSKAAKQGYANAQYVLAQCYYYGEGIDKDISKALEWYNKAAEQGLEEAKKRLEEIHQSKNNSIYYLFFDTETTGLFIDESKSMNPLRNQVLSNSLLSRLLRQPHMVQLSWITTDKDCNIISQNDYIIQPKGFSIPPEATRIHGITTEIAKEKGTPLKDVIEKFMEDVYAANTLVGHNIDFDKKVIDTELQRLRLNGEYDDMNSYGFNSKESLCTMKTSVPYCEIPSSKPTFHRPYKQPKLQELHKKLFGCEFEDAHNSMSDVTATLKCFKEMRRLGWI